MRDIQDEAAGKDFAGEFTMFSRYPSNLGNSA